MQDWQGFCLFSRLEVSGDNALFNLWRAGGLSAILLF
jgi:hypothetical protein